MALTTTYIASLKAHTHTHTEDARCGNVAELFKIQRNACARGDKGKVHRLDLQRNKERQINTQKENERGRCMSQQSARKQELRDIKRAQRI